MSAEVREKDCNCSGINCARGEGYTSAEIWGQVCSDEDGGGVEEDDVAARAGLAGEDGGEDGGVGLGVASDEGFGGGSGEASVLGGDGGEGDDAVVDFGDVGGAEDGDFVETGAIGCGGCAVDDEGVAGTELGHGFGDEGDEVRGVDAHDLRGCSGGIGEGAEEVEDGADSEGAADGHDGLHRRVEAGGVEEGEAMRSEGGGGFDGREADGDAEGFEDVCGAGLRCDGAVAVLGYGGSGGCGDEGGGGGDVEGTGGITAGAAGVDEELALGGFEGEGGGGGAHGFDEAGDFGGGFAAGGEGSEESGDFDVGELAGEDLLHEVAGVFAGERGAAFDEVLEMRLKGH